MRLKKVFCTTKQTSLETRPFTWAGNDPINAFSGAPLLAEYDDSSITQAISNSVVSSETTILHPGIIKNSSLQVGSLQVGSSQVTTSQIGSPKISLNEDGFLKTTLVQTNVAEIRPTQISSISKELIETGFTQIDSPQISSADISIVQVDSGEISFSSHVTLQQSLSSHNFNLQNTTVSAWISFLQAQTPFNLNVEVTDLPTGQLAEAHITNFNSHGTSTGGTLLLDNDANGLGWFIDPTPWENSEFASQTTDSAYKSTPGSAAYGHYDLLTTLLHELGHIAGFISGNPAYDAHIQTLNSTPTFVGDQFHRHPIE